MIIRFLQSSPPVWYCFISFLRLSISVGSGNLESPGVSIERDSRLKVRRIRECVIEIMILRFLESSRPVWYWFISFLRSSVSVGSGNLRNRKFGKSRRVCIVRDSRVKVRRIGKCVIHIMILRILASSPPIWYSFISFLRFWVSVGSENLKSRKFGKCRCVFIIRDSSVKVRRIGKCLIKIMILRFFTNSQLVWYCFISFLRWSVSVDSKNLRSRKFGKSKVRRRHANVLRLRFEVNNIRHDVSKWHV